MPTINEIILAAEDLAQVGRSPLERWRRANGRDFDLLINAFGQSERQGIERQYFFKAARSVLSIPINPVELEREVVELVKAQRNRIRTGGAQTVLSPPDPLIPRTR